MNAQILRILPTRVQDLITKLPQDKLTSIEEIRIRIERPLEIVSTKFDGFLTEDGIISQYPGEGIIINKEEGLQILNVISNYSLYALEEELRRGYVTIQGGHRVGMVGKVVLVKGQIAHLRDVTGFNIRIAKEVKGVAETFLSYLWSGRKIYNTLIISPPRCGKTTILRDLTRIFSYGLSSLKIPGVKIGLVDERSEIAGCVNGIPQKDIGPRTDVLDGCPKAEGMMMLIRSMSPQLIVTDEIGRDEDVVALLEAIHAGVSLFASVHGSSLEEILSRPSLEKLTKLGIFDRYLVLSKRNGVGTLEGVFDRQGRSLLGVTVS